MTVMSGIVSGVVGPVAAGLTVFGSVSEAALIDSWQFTAWEQAVHDRFERDYLNNAPILRGTQIYIDQDAAGDATGGGGSGTSGDPYLCDTWDDVCDLLMSNITVNPDTAIVFKDGDYYEGTHQLNITDNNITICTRDQYTAALGGDKEPAPSNKVFINHFTIKIAASASWTNTTGDIYWISEPTQVYMIRKQTERLTDGEQFRFMASEAALGTLGTDQRGFWYDTVNDRVYIKVTNGENPADFAWECVNGLAHATNTSPRRGTIYASNRTGLRISGIRTDGFGFIFSDSDNAYGITLEVGNNNFYVADNVEAYFNNRHNIGGAGNNGFGGTMVWKNWKAGFMADPNGTCFVSYNAPGGNVSFVSNGEIIAGSIPENNTTSRKLGRGLFTHADASNQTGKHYWFDCEALDHEFGVLDIASGANLQGSIARDDDLPFSEFTAYFVRFKDERFAVGSGGQAICLQIYPVLNIGHRLFIRPAQGNTALNFAGASPRTAVAINCVQVLDMQDISSATPYDFGLYNGGGANSGLAKLAQLYNCFMAAKNVGSNINVNYLERSNNSFSTPPSTIFLMETRNNVMAKLSGAGNVRPGHGNNVGQNSNNAYFGMTESNSSANRNRGYDNCTDFVELSSAPWFDTIPQSGDQIFEAGNRPPKAFEDRDGFRFPTPPDIATRSSLADYVPNSVRFDGTSDGMTASIGGSVADGPSLILAFKIIPKDISSTQRVFGTRNGRILTRFSNFGGVFFTGSLENSSSGALAGGTTGVNIVDEDVPYIFLLTADTSALAIDPHFRCVYKQIGTPGAWTTAFNSALDSTGNIDFTDAQFLIGQANGGVERLNACIGDLYVGQGTGNALDTALQAKFLDANGLPVQLGQYGERVTGTAPLIFLRNDFETFQNNNSNLGLQGNFTVTGTLAEGDSFV